MGLALLFPGQGSQHPLMLPWLDAEAAARPALEALSTLLPRPWRDGGAGPAWWQTNAVAQPLVTGVAIAAWQALASQLPAPAVVAGYSVGELAACAAAGCFDTAAALSLAARRAQAMDAAAAGHKGGLLALQGARALQLAQSTALSVAIRIGEEFVIVGGPLAELEAQALAWTALGLRCTPLPIAIASHTPAMAAAAAAFARHLLDIPPRPARVPVVSNASGNASRSAPVLAAALAEQIATTVRWDDCMDCIAERQVRCVLEVGPGAALAAMWRDRHPGIPSRSVDEFQSAEGVVRWVRQQLG